MAYPKICCNLITFWSLVQQRTQKEMQNKSKGKLSVGAWMVYPKIRCNLIAFWSLVQRTQSDKKFNNFKKLIRVPEPRQRTKISLKEVLSIHT